MLEACARGDNGVELGLLISGSLTRLHRVHDCHEISEQRFRVFHEVGENIDIFHNVIRGKAWSTSIQWNHSKESTIQWKNKDSQTIW